MYRALFRIGVLGSLIWALANGASAFGDDAFYSVRIADVELTDGKLPGYELRPTDQVPFPGADRVPAPYVAIDGDGEGLVELQNRFTPWSFTQQDYLDAEILVRVPAPREITGRLYLPSGDLKSYVITRFRIPADKANVNHSGAFYVAKASELQHLLNDQVPGGAWFRHELRETQRALQQAPAAPPAENTDFGLIPNNSLDDTYALFTGGRAISENLALDRTLTSEGTGPKTVELSSITGITIAEIDWTKLIEGKSPSLDPLASLIPADQHAVFFPTFDAYLQAMDELRGNSAPVLQIAEPRAEDARTVAKYEKQLGVPMTLAARLFGGKVVKSVAITGSDPYFRVGTDVALLFETDQPEVLKQLLWTQMQQSSQGAKEQGGKYGAVEYLGFRSEDRTISGYVAVLPGAVLLTNSPYQVERAAAVVAKTAAPLASLDEFKFFRDRYPLAADDETAFVFLSDATIRRWCGPQWRIASSRRARDVAVLADMQARYLTQLVRGEARPGPIHTDLTMVSGGELALATDGVRSPVYNTLGFQTPISELSLDKVTAEEAASYERWRTMYQRNWRWAFDPIGVKLTLNKQSLGADMTVMPLVAQSEYQTMVSVTQGSKIPPGAGDPHDTLAHVMMSINHDALPVRQYAGLASAMAPGAKIDVLSWLGDTVGFYLDRDPLWGELMDPKLDNRQREELLRAKDYALPLAVRIDSRSNLKLAAFLAGARAYIEQTGPGLTAWEALKHQEHAYVKIGATPQAGETGVPEKFAIYYGVIGDALVVTPNEGVLKRAIERQNTKKNQGDKPESANVEPWLGENIALQADRAAADAMYAVGEDQYRLQLQRLSWSNLPILNAWHRLFPDKDPVKLHETYWHARLVCPGGGEYVWNDEYQTMESTVFGSPVNRKMEDVQVSPLQQFERGNFGLTFENQGLRARVQLKRAAK
jgi:hypothetical protein